MITLDQLLASRDARVEHQMELAEKFPRASLICLTVMLPGPVKRDWRSLAIAHAGVDAIHAVFGGQGESIPYLRFAHPSHPDGWAPPVHVATGGHGSGMDTPCSATHILFSEERDLETGFEAYFVVDVPVLEAKRLCCQIEDSHPLGRLMDIDVLRSPIGSGMTEGSGKTEWAGMTSPVSRTEIGLPERRCLLCDKPARGCMRAHTHTREELEDKILSMLEATLTIRPAKGEDLKDIMAVLDAARGIMRASGNMDQWTGGYPSEEVVFNDIRLGNGYVVLQGQRIVSYFAFIASPEPTYAKIYQGQWLEDTLPYHVVHRIGSYPQVRGVFKAVMDWCFARENNIRIDTHRDNRIMQHVILKYGFRYCGIIFLASGDERLAYQKLHNMR